MKNQFRYLSLLIPVAIVACNPKPAPTSQNDISEIAPPKIDTALSNNNEVNDFANQAALGGMMEVESGARMIKYTENPDIQTLATIMVKDHGTANAELKTIAKKNNLTLPQTLPADKQEQLKQLGLLEEFQANLIYADLMVKEHQSAVTLFTNASQNQTNADLKAFANKYLPILKAHYSHALNVQKIIHAIKNDKGDIPLKISKDRKS